MKADTADLEAERAWLHDMIQSAGWKIYTANWSKMLAECEKALREKDNPTRDWSAGLCTGYQRLLQWPVTRIKNIDSELEDRNAKAA